MNIIKGQKVEVTIEDMSAEGAGIGRMDSGDSGFVVFVPGAVCGDKVRATLKKVKKRYAIGELVEILEPSADRRDGDEICPYCDECGGCPFGVITYERQLAIKEMQVKNKLQRLGNVDFACSGIGSGDEAGALLEPIISMDESDNFGAGNFGYRNKASMAISTGGYITEKGGIRKPVHEPRIGFRIRKSHEVVDCEECRLQATTAMAAADAVRRFMVEDHICSYDKRWDGGLMESMTVKTAFGTGEVMVVFDIHGKGIPGVSKLIEYLDDSVYEAGGSLESVVVRFCDGKRAGETEVIAGYPVIKDEIPHPANLDGVLRFEISANSFYQVNAVQMVRLYDKVREYCFEDDGEFEVIEGLIEGRGKQAPSEMAKKPVVLDLYCGIGTIGLYLADRAEAVVGIEAVPDAVRDANRNAVINGIVNARYICGKAEEFLPKAVAGKSGADEDIETLIKAADVAILDPPRAGSDVALLDAVSAACIDRIVYVSCDAATLARDVKYLGELGYRLEKATPVDMFPETGCVETVVLLPKI